MFYFEKINGKSVLKSDVIPDKNHFFTTKEFILKTKEHDMLERAKNNLYFLKNKFNLKKIVSPKQTHSSNIAIVEENRDVYDDTDALIFNLYDTGVFLNFADCTPIILYDKKNKIYAIVHAGWRGTAKAIVTKSIDKMKNAFNCNPAEICAAIGPSICYNCFETGNEVIEQLKTSVSDTEGLVKTVRGKFYADLAGFNARQLSEAGVKSVDIAPFCTYHNNEKFFSYRKENKTTNRISAFAFIKK